MNALAHTAAALVSAEAAGLGAPTLAYDADLGTAPDAQGWVRGGNVTPGVGITVEGGVLTQSTLPSEPAPCYVCRSVFWVLPTAPIGFDGGVAFEAELRIVSSQYSASFSGAPRPGFAIEIFDRHGHVYRIGFGESRVFLASSLDGAFVDPTVAELEWTTTDTAHVYRLEATPAGARLLIDGAETLSLDGPGPVVGAADIALIGDNTGWANSAAEIRRFAFGPLAACPADLAPPFGLLDLNDITAFVAGFTTMDPIADLNTDGVFDLADVNLFVNAFVGGCP